MPDRSVDSGQREVGDVLETRLQIRSQRAAGKFHFRRLWFASEGLYPHQVLPAVGIGVVGLMDASGVGGAPNPQ